MSEKYILDANGNPVPEENLLRWGKWFETADRTVANDTIGAVRVSTVFLGLDHAFGGGPPMLFETMIFGGVHDEFQQRYSTREQAIAGHAQAIDLVDGVG
jgi:hypothetical protein